MNKVTWMDVALALILIGLLLWGVHIVSESKECASKGGEYINGRCLKAEVIQ